jgi:nucleoside-diphosphate-sugar epimerase
LLQSAKKYGKSVKSIAVTGSINAATDGSDIVTRVFDSTQWLPLTIEDAIKAQHPYISYCVAKAEAEKAIWKFVEEEKPAFSVEVLLPGLIFGPPIQPITDIKHINFSTDVFYSLFNGSNESIPDTPFPSYVSFDPLLLRYSKAGLML